MSRVASNPGDRVYVSFYGWVYICILLISLCTCCIFLVVWMRESTVWSNLTKCSESLSPRPVGRSHLPNKCEHVLLVMISMCVIKERLEHKRIRYFKYILVFAYCGLIIWNQFYLSKTLQTDTLGGFNTQSANRDESGVRAGAMATKTLSAQTTASLFPMHVQESANDTDWDMTRSRWIVHCVVWCVDSVLYSVQWGSGLHWEEGDLCVQPGPQVPSLASRGCVPVYQSIWSF